VPVLLREMLCCEVCSATQELASDGSLQPPPGYTWTSLESFADAGSPAVLKDSENKEPHQEVAVPNTNPDGENDASQAQSEASDRTNGAKGASVTVLL
jgi:hypothetical protein